MLSFRTTGYNGYGVQYSPFFDNKLAVATAANYGLVGNGRLFILSIEPDGSIKQQNIWDTQDGLFDVAWSEAHENQVAVSSGDGSIKIFDIMVPQFPIRNYKEHTKEVFSVNWNLVDKGNFISSSWDGTMKLWCPQRQASILTLHGNTSSATDNSHMSEVNPPKTHHQMGRNLAVDTTNCIYNATFSPHSPSTILSCNGSSHLQVWDTRAPSPLQMDFIAHGGLETLSCDWNKYQSSIVASVSSDKSVRIWDLRMLPTITSQAQSPIMAYRTRTATPLTQLVGHQFAIRKVTWSPHSADELLTASYDMTCKVWKNLNSPNTQNSSFSTMACFGTMHLHREFVIGCDYSLWGEPGWVASTGWDEQVYVWDSKRLSH